MPYTFSYLFFVFTVKEDQQVPPQKLSYVIVQCKCHNKKCLGNVIYLFINVILFICDYRLELPSPSSAHVNMLTNSSHDGV